MALDEQPQAGSLGPEVQAEEAAPVDPLAQYDKQKEVAETRRKFSRFAQQRRPFEGAWFLNAAMFRGQQRVEYNDALGRLVTHVIPASRLTFSINRIRPKIVTRLSKFFKNRPRPIVIPASGDQQDILNARATEQFLTYQWYKGNLEQKYRDARLWATVGSKGFLWVRWNSALAAKVRLPGEAIPGDPVPAQPVDEVVPNIGDIEVEVGSPFEVYPADNTIAHLGKQPEFIRAKMRDKADLQRRYPHLTFGEGVQADNNALGASTEKTIERLGTLNKRQDDRGFGGQPTADAEDKTKVLTLEHFIAPCGKYPQGRFKIIVGQELARIDEQLPHGFYEYPDNPYPVVEFSDAQNPGQFWNTTLVEQLVDLQREYNLIRNLISENLRMMARPKIVVYKQHQLAEGAWTNAAGEIVELTYIPGLPPVQIVQPANIAGDAWQMLALINREFDDLTLLPPAAMGKTGDTTSGYQTNLLQEAADGAHAPDIRQDELAIQELAWKMRRLAKVGYTAPRLLSVLGDGAATEVMAFSQDQIDEFAEVRIQAGSMLPDLKTSRIQMVKEMFKDGLFGNPQDPSVRKRVVGLIDLGGIEQVQSLERADKDEAYREETLMTAGQGVLPAQLFQFHPDHLEVHELELKSPRFKTLPPQIQQAKIAHWITHQDFVNPTLSMGLRMQYNLVTLPLATPPILPSPAQPMSPGTAPPGANPSAASPQGPAPTPPPSAA